MEGQNSSQEDRLSGGFRECYHVMVVDDEPENLELLERRLSRVGYDVSTASSAREALGNIEERQPDIILLDITMPDVSGRQMLLILRKTTQTHTLPVIMVSGLGDSENIAGALREGANDYVTKPIDMDILLARMETHLRLGATIRQLETQKELLQRLAAYDELTGVYNRRSMFDALDSQFGVSRRMNRSFSILMIDLDNFKSINDSHGHAAGDEVLKGFCNRMKNLLRSMDILSRYGGEEFCAILPELNSGMALSAAERVRYAIAHAPVLVGDKAVPLSVSIGVSSYRPGDDITPRQLIDDADKALYEAKRKGRNRVCSHRREGDTERPELSRPKDISERRK